MRIVNIAKTLLMTAAVISTIIILSLTVSARSGNFECTMNVGEEKYLSFSSSDVSEIVMLDGFINSTGWYSNAPEVSVIWQDFTSCQIRVNEYTSLQPIVIRCDINYIAYIGNYPRIGTTAVDFEIFINEQKHEHPLQHYERVEPTHTVMGTIEHWYCMYCDKCFSDSKGTVEVSGNKMGIPTTKEHNYKATVVKPTESAEGYTLYKCACGASYKDNLTPKLTPSPKKVENKASSGGGEQAKAPETEYYVTEAPQPVYQEPAVTAPPAETPDSAQKAKQNNTKKNNTKKKTEKKSEQKKSVNKVWLNSGGIKAQSAQSVFPAGTKVSVKRLNPEELTGTVIKGLRKISKKFILYKISAVNKNKSVTPDGALNLSLPIPDGYDKDSVAVVYVNSVGKVAHIDSKLSKDKSSVEINVKNLGNIALIEKTPSVNERVKLLDEGIIEYLQKSKITVLLGIVSVIAIGSGFFS